MNMMNKKYMALLLGAAMGLSSFSATAATTDKKTEVKTEAAATVEKTAEKTDKCFLGQVTKAEKEKDGSVKLSLKVVKSGEKNNYELTDNEVELLLAQTVNVQKEKESKTTDAAKTTDKKAAAGNAAADKAATGKAATDKAATDKAATTDKKAATDKKAPDMKTVLTAAEKELNVKAAETLMKTVMDKGSAEDLKEGTVVLVSFKQDDFSITDVRVLTSVKVEEKKAEQKAVKSN